MSFTMMFASVLLSQGAMTAAMPGEAAVASAAPDERVITATAQVNRSGWLTTSGPDAEGHYRAWITVSDLDLASAAGASALHARAARAAAVLCAKSADGASLPGFYDKGARACWRDTEAQALAQAKVAQAGTGMGKHVAVLALAR